MGNKIVSGRTPSLVPLSSKQALAELRGASSSIEAPRGRRSAAVSCKRAVLALLLFGSGCFDPTLSAAETDDGRDTEHLVSAGSGEPASSTGAVGRPQETTVAGETERTDGPGIGGSTAMPGGDQGTNTGTCTSRCKEDGAACESASECMSARCVDGVCCDTACDGPCEACAEVQTRAADGFCAPVTAGTDPDDDCGADDTASCERDGTCDGEGSCALYDEQTVCGAPACMNGTASSERRCDGAGECLPAEASACAPYACGATSCLSACETNGVCSNGHVCIENECRMPSALLGPCDEPGDCAEGECFGTICGLAVEYIRITGEAVPGGGGHLTMDGWFTCDEEGQGLSRVSQLSAQFYYQSIDEISRFDQPLPPDTYFVLTGSQGSNPITRDFQFGLSDGRAIVRSVEAATAHDVLLFPPSESTMEGTDRCVLFHWTGADVEVIRADVALPEP